MAKDRKHGHDERPHRNEPAHHEQGERMRNPGGAHEHRDINVRAIFAFLITLTVIAFAVQVGLWGMFKYLKGSYNALDPEPNPMLSGQRKPPEKDPARDFPKPRLQALIAGEKTDPAAELSKFRQENEAILNGPPTWVDEQAGIVRIPIDQAMQLTLERGLPYDASAPGATPATLPGAGKPAAGSTTGKKTK